MQLKYQADCAEEKRNYSFVSNMSSEIVDSNSSYMRVRSETCSSIDSLLSSDDSQLVDRKAYSSEELDYLGNSNSGRSSDCDESFNVVIDEGRKKKIIDFAEFYLSDDQVLKDVFLLKHIRRNKEGYISLKLLSSYKKMKSTTKDWREVAAAVIESEMLEVNSCGTKVRRKNPLPEHDETTPSRVVLAFNFPFEKPTVMDLTERFSRAGDITSIRLVNPGTISADIKKYKIKHRALGSTLCALVEYDSFNAASRCADLLCTENDSWRSVKVFHSASNTDSSNHSVKGSLFSPKKKRSKPKSQMHQRLSESSSGYSTSHSLNNSDVESANVNRIPSKSMKIENSRRKTHVKANSYSESRNASVLDTDWRKVQSKLDMKPQGSRRYSEGNVLQDEDSCDRKRVSSVCVAAKSAVQIIRNPIGPSDAPGFRLNRPGRKA